jgi:outer membrane lipoprotein-sorting protein
MQHSFPRRLAACFGVLLAVVMVSAPGEAPAPKAVFNDAQKAALDRVSAYLNGIHVLKSGFIQLAPDGQLDQGEFLLEKPGKLRFEYNAPNPTLIVATGGKFYVKNGRLNTVDSYDISDTPLGLLLSDNVDLKNNSAVTGIDIRPDELVLHARTFNNRQQQGVITMVFSNPGIELRQWTVKDNQGGTTDFALRNPEATPGPVDEALFDVPHKDPPRKAASR